MLEEDPLPTCLSDLPHGPDTVSDFLRHYFGCIETHERETFRDRTKNKDFWGRQAAIELSRLRATAVPSGPGRAREEDQVKKTIVELAIAIEAWYKRTQLLRAALSKALDDDPAYFVEFSRREWRASDEYRDGIGEARRWRQLKGLHTDPAGRVERNMAEPEHGRQCARDIIVGFRGLGALEHETSDYGL